MKFALKEVRLDKLNIPAEALRDENNLTQDALLKESLTTHGVLIPFLLTELGKGEYAVWDGGRRTALLRDLGTPGSETVPAHIVQGGDADGVVNQIHINQFRERLSAMAEVEGLRQLVKSHGLSLAEAARQLLKSKSWASISMKIYKLPLKVLTTLRNGDITLSNAKVLTSYIDNPQILNMLYDVAIKGGIAHERLAALGAIAERDGLQKAKQTNTGRIAVGKNSWMRLEPLRKGMRVELHLSEGDDYAEAAKKLQEAMKKMK
ncbi:MAG: hypothetical protein R8K20_02585 [Gallionellaceae bacterium]